MCRVAKRAVLWSISLPFRGCLILLPFWFEPYLFGEGADVLKGSTPGGRKRVVNNIGEYGGQGVYWACIGARKVGEWGIRGKSV